MQTVNQLIKDGRWNIDILQEISNQEGREQIASMPLSLFKRQDRFFWSFSKSGVYTVRTGYANAVQERSDERRRESIEEETSWEIRKHSIWKQLWKLNLKPKLKHCIWKCS